MTKYSKSKSGNMPSEKRVVAKSTDTAQPAKPEPTAIEQYKSLKIRIMGRDNFKFNSPREPVFILDSLLNR